MMTTTTTLIDENRQKLFTKFTKCGDILLNGLNNLEFSCCLCYESFLNLKTFIAHSKEQHYFLILETSVDDDDDEFIIEQLESESDLIENNLTEERSTSINDNDQKLYLAEAIDKDSIISDKNNFVKKKLDTVLIEKSSKKVLNKNEPITNQLNLIKPVNKKTKCRQTGEWQCKICSFICPRGTKRQEHQRSHLGLKRFTCEQCGKSYTTKPKLLYHLKDHSGERPWECDFCLKKFKSSHLLRQHQFYNHLNNKSSLKCNICAKVVSHPRTLEMHIRRHQAKISKHIECDLCKKKFSDELKMQTHRINHKFKEKTYKCKECPKSFQINYNLAVHIRLEHLGEYNYECEYCDRKFIKLSVKKSHELIHTRTESQRFYCDECNKNFTSKKSLDRHKKSQHSNINEFLCRKCTQQFKSKADYIIHCREHNMVDKKHFCTEPDCDSRFENAANLKNHWLRKHKNKI